MGRPGDRWPAARASSPRRPASPSGPPPTSSTALELTLAWSAPAWELRTAGDWLRSGAPVPDRAVLGGRVLGLARDLELPWVAARFADAVT